MGILNVTPDSFSDGGDHYGVEFAVNGGIRLAEAGADIIDIGGQSTRPGAETIALSEELDRVIPVIETLRSRLDLPISIDTTRSEVAKAALAAGADIINDISGGTFEPEILAIAAKFDAPIVLMHLRGTPQTMQSLTDYEDLMGEIGQFLGDRLAAAVDAGCDARKIIIDPGIGFAKTGQQNLTILRELDKLRSLNCPILVGPSRKSFIGRILQQDDPKQRLFGTAAACTAAIAASADIIRVHDVREMSDVCRVADAIFRDSELRLS